MAKPRSIIPTLVATLILCTAGTSWAEPVGTAFTYQGQLKEGGCPASGTYDFYMILYNASMGGSQVGDAVEILGKVVTNGLFTVSLDFGDVFLGDALWLEVYVRQSDGGSYQLLSPRQELTPAPYTLYALGGDHGSLSGLGDDDHPQYVLDDEPDSVTTAMIEDEAVTGAKIAQGGAGNGQVLKWNEGSWVPQDDAVGSCLWQIGSEGIYYNGHVGIGTDSPYRTLHVVPDSSGIWFDMTNSTGVVRILEGSPEDDCFEVDGHSSFDGTVSFHDMAKFWDVINWYNPPVNGGTPIVINEQGYFYKQGSSLRYKSNVADLPSTADALLALRPVSFEWKSTGEPDIGLIAEEVAEVIPDLVLYDAEGRPDAVKYDRLGVYLLQIVKSQRGQIGELREQNQRFESRLAALETLVAELGNPKDGGGQ